MDLSLFKQRYPASQCQQHLLEISTSLSRFSNPALFCFSEHLSSLLHSLYQTCPLTPPLQPVAPAALYLYQKPLFGSLQALKQIALQVLLHPNVSHLYQLESYSRYPTYDLLIVLADSFEGSLSSFSDELSTQVSSLGGAVFFCHRQSHVQSLLEKGNPFLVRALHPSRLLYQHSQAPSLIPPAFEEDLTAMKARFQPFNQLAAHSLDKAEHLLQSQQFLPAFDEISHAATDLLIGIFSALMDTVTPEMDLAGAVALTNRLIPQLRHLFKPESYAIHRVLALALKASEQPSLFPLTREDTELWLELTQQLRLLIQQRFHRLFDCFIVN